MLKTLLKQIGTFKTASILTPIFIALEVVMGVLIPYVTSWIIDEGIAKSDLGNVYKYGAIMLVLAAMCYLIEAGAMPGWAVAVVIFREFAVSGLRLVAAERSIVIAAAQSGKIKTACTMVCLCIMLFFLGRCPLWLNNLCIALIVITTVYSGFEYFRNNYRVFSE